MIWKLIRWLRLALSARRLNAYQAAHILSLQQQLGMYKRREKKPKFTRRDRLFWMILYRLWPGCIHVLENAKPNTLIRWHKAGFRQFWRWKSRPKKPGRPRISPEIQDLIRLMAEANPGWGAPRIHGELLLLGFEVHERTVFRYLERIRHSPAKRFSQTWMTFLRNHASKLVSIDFLVTYTVTFKLIYVLVVLSHDRRRVLHFNVTSNPTAEWTAQQIVQAFPWDSAPEYLLRDRDKIYGDVFKKRIKGMGMEELLISFRSPWQSPYVERLIGSIRKECLDHMIILNERHLKGILKEYFAYYHDDRTHYNLGKQTPSGRLVQPKPFDHAVVVALPRLGGLHHRYEWRVAA